MEYVLNVTPFMLTSSFVWKVRYGYCGGDYSTIIPRETTKLKAGLHAHNYFRKP